MRRTPRQRLRLALLRNLARFTRPPKTKARGESTDAECSDFPCRILVIRPDHLGDLLFTTPALRELRRRYPTAHITALIGPWGIPMLKNNPHVDEVLTCPFPGFSRQSKPSPLHPYRILYHWARQLYAQYDLAFTLRFDHWWGALLAYMAGVPQRVGYAVAEVLPFINRPVPYTAGWHEVTQNLRLANWEQRRWQQDSTWSDRIEPNSHPLEFHLADGVVARSEKASGSTRPIAIHPGAGAAIKLWRVEGWAAVADTLADETGSRILLTGSDAERALCDQIAAHMRCAPTLMAGKTTFDELAALFTSCRLVLGLDSGPLHLAVASGTPTVHLYGPVDASAFGPWGDPERHRALSSEWPCIPCNRLDYGTDEVDYHPCVREISTDLVLTTARELL